jgi:hypothetical protein
MWDDSIAIINAAGIRADHRFPELGRNQVVLLRSPAPVPGRLEGRHRV